MPDWHLMFIPQTTILEVVVRGTIMYFVLFLILRFFMKRQAGGLGIADVLVIVLIADAAQNGMAADYKSVTEGALLVLTIAFWDFAIDWLGYHVSFLGRLIQPAPIPLIKDGHMLHRNMRAEMISKDELMSQLREQGIEDPRQVKRACMEANGNISVIRFDGDETAKPKDRKVAF